MNKYNIDQIDILKIDIEGAELFALQGMQKTIKKWLPVILIEINPFFLKTLALPPRS